MEYLYTLSGLIGDVCVIGSYFLLVRGTLKGDGLIYLMINLIGAIGLMISLIKNWNLPSVIIEIFWISITLYGLTKLYLKKKQLLGNKKYF